MKHSSKYIVVFLAILALSVVFFQACSPSSTTARKNNRHPDISYPIADFTLTERSGKKVHRSDLLGKVWIASFVFTRCTGPCPQVTATMARLQQELENKPEIKLVTFTVDPNRDDPAELRKYAEHFRADKDRWWFLTGKEEEIHHLLQDSFKIGITRNPKATEPGQEFDHSTRLVVVDRHGNVRGYYRGIADPETQGNDPALEADLKKLKEKINELLETDQ